MKLKLHVLLIALHVSLMLILGGIDKIGYVLNPDSADSIWDAGDVYAKDSDDDDKDKGDDDDDDDDDDGGEYPDGGFEGSGAKAGEDDAPVQKS